MSYYYFFSDKHFVNDVMATATVMADGACCGWPLNAVLFEFFLSSFQLPAIYCIDDRCDDW